MATLQEQSDSAFLESDSMTPREQQAAEDANGDLDTGYPVIEFADQEDDEGYDAPTPLEYDGKGLKKPVDQIEFADDETNPGAVMGTEVDDAGEMPEQTLIDDHDIHGRRRGPDVHSQEPSEPQGLSDAAIKRAQQYGLHPAQARADYKSDAELKRAIQAFDQQLFLSAQGQQQQPPQQQPLHPNPLQQPIQQQWNPQQQQQFVPQPPQQAPPPAQPPVGTPVAPVPGQPAQVGPDGQPLTPAEQQAAFEAYQLQHAEIYDDGMLEDLQGMSQHHQQLFTQQAQELSQLRQMFEQQQQAQQREARRQYVEDFDKSIQDLGEAWTDVFGRGSHVDLDPNSAELFHRGKVLQTANQLAQLHAQQGRHVDRTAILESALTITFPDRNGSVRQQSAPAAQPTQQQRRHDVRDASSGRYTVRPGGNASSKQGSSLNKLYAQWDQLAGHGQNDFADDDF